jgi:hypothetical protein
MKYSKQFVEFLKIFNDSSFEFISINYWQFLFCAIVIYVFFFFSLIRQTQFGRKVETFPTFAPGSNFFNSASDSGDNVFTIKAVKAVTMCTGPNSFWQLDKRFSIVLVSKWIRTGVLCKNHYNVHRSEFILTAWQKIFYCQCQNEFGPEYFVRTIKSTLYEYIDCAEHKRCIISMYTSVYTSEKKIIRLLCSAQSICIYRGENA